MRERLLDPSGRRAAEYVARSKRAFQRQMVDDVRTKERRELLELGEAEGLQPTMAGDRRRYHSTHQAMRVAKGHAFPGEVVGELRRPRIALAGRLAHQVPVE